MKNFIKRRKGIQPKSNNCQLYTLLIAFCETCWDIHEYNDKPCKSIPNSSNYNSSTEFVSFIMSKCCSFGPTGQVDIKERI